MSWIGFILFFMSLINSLPSVVDSVISDTPICDSVWEITIEDEFLHAPTQEAVDVRAEHYGCYNFILDETQYSNSIKVYYDQTLENIVAARTQGVDKQWEIVVATSALDLKSVMIHEFGHMFGFGHTNNNIPIMHLKNWGTTGWENLFEYSFKQ